MGKKPQTSRAPIPPPAPPRPGVAAHGPLSRLRPERLALWTLLAILLAYVLLLAPFHEAAYYGSVDEASYLLQARQIATHGLGPWPSSDPAAYMPDNFLEVRPGQWYSKYPVGYPLLLALLYRIGGFSAPFLLNPIAAVLLIAGTFALASRLVGSRAAVFAALLTACHPLVFLFSNNALSHMTDACCAVWAMYFAWTWAENLRPYHALVAGLLAGYAVSIRYTEALLALPLLMLALGRLRAVLRADRANRPRVLRGIALLFVGGLLGILALALYNTAAFGAPWITGYHLTGEASAFGPLLFLHHAWIALRMLCAPGFGLFLVFPLAAAGLIYLAFQTPRLAAFLALWIVPTLLIYIAYYWVATATPSLYLRFFFSIYPPLIIAALAGAHRLLQHRHRYAETAVAVVLIATTAAGFADAPVQRGILIDTRDMAAYAELGAAAARTYVPPDTLLLADCGWANYLVYAGNYRTYNPDVFKAAWLDLYAAGRHANGANAPGPNAPVHAVYNPLRAARFNEALASKDQAQLTAALCDRLRQEYARHWPAMLITKPEYEKPWSQWLGPDWELRRCNPPEQYWVAVYDLVPKSSTTLPASSPATTASAAQP